MVELARLRDAGLADWIAAEGAFPSTMVDRIVPATKEEDIARLAELTGVLDLSPVMHEPFRQWVVEDRFVGGARPDLGAVGVQLVEDVTPFETDEAALPERDALGARLSRLSRRARDDQRHGGGPGLRGLRAAPVAGGDHPDGAAAAGGRPRRLCRGAVPALRQPGDPAPDLADRHGRLAEAAAAHPRDDRRRAGRGRETPGLALAVAAWMRYVGGVDEKGAAIDVRDPLAARLQGAVGRGGDAGGEGRGAARGARRSSRAALAEDAGFRTAVTEAYRPAGRRRGARRGGAGCGMTNAAPRTISTRWTVSRRPEAMLDTATPLVLSPADNVAILTARAPQGARPLGLGVELAAPVMPGHKIAREDIPEGGAIVKFGQVIGYATKPIAAGEHVHAQNCEFGAHDQDYHVGADLAAAQAAIPVMAPRTFQGYRRANGQVGTRNYIAVCATVNCSATVIRRAAEQVMASGRARRLSRTSTGSSPSPTARAAGWRRAGRGSTTSSGCSGGMRRIRTSGRRSSSGSAAR